MALPGHAQTFDQYGGDMAQSCTASPNGVFTVQKVGSRWYFCTPAGHVYIAQAVATFAQTNPAYDCQTNTFNSTGTTLAWVNQGPTYPNTYAACINVNNIATWTPAKVCQDGLSSANAASCLSGNALTHESTLSATDATAGSWFYDGAGNLYVHTTTGDNPANHATMDYPENVYNIYTAKYGDVSYNWAWQQLKRLKSFKFNALGQDTLKTELLPWTTCNNCAWGTGTNIPNPVPVPVIYEIKPAESASRNECNCMQSPMKDLLKGTNSNYPGYRGGSTYDVFDPGLNISFQTGLSANSPLNNPAQYPWIPAVFTDDSDFLTGMMWGPDFVFGLASGEAQNVGFITLISSPVQAFVQKNNYKGSPTLYPDPQQYTKASITNPVHGTCSVTSPCSLRDYLYDEYSGSISSLNAAWGSNYTSFDTAGTCFGYSGDQNGGNICPNNPVQSAITVGAGNGTTTAFSKCLGTGTYPSCSITSPISPFSVLISVAGTPQAGDCPWLECPNSGKTLTNTGTIGSPTTGYISAGTTGELSVVNYSTGALTITFGTAPANGAAITAKFITEGWMAGGTGLADENGANAWVGTNSVCLEGADPNYPTYFFCTGQGGDYQPLPSDAFQISSITVNGTTATVNISPAKTGGYTLANNQTVYLSGATSSSCNGGPYIISNTGNTATSFTITTPAGCTNQASSAGWVNSAFGHDLDGWASQYAAKYFKTMHDDLRATAPCVIAKCWTGTNVHYFGIDNMGVNRFELPGAAPYLNASGTDDGGAFVGLGSYFKEYNLQPQEFLSQYQYFTHYLGDVPIIDSTQSPASTQDSPYACYGSSQYATQTIRGQKWYETVNDLQTTLSANSTYQVVGTSWWEYYDAQNFNQGLISLHDNAYDGVEGVNASVACDSSYTSKTNCGLEPANFGDMASSVTNANSVWTGLITSSPVFSYSPSPVAFGTVNVGSNSSLTTTITNAGTTSLILGSLGAPSDTEFTVSNDFCSGKTLAANGTCNFTLTFTPTSGGQKSASIAVPDNTGGSDSISASGTGQTITMFTLTVGKAGTGLGTITSTDTNINCGSVCSFSYVSGTQVTLNASPSSGSSFIGWTGGGCTTGTCIVTMTGNTTVTATFNQNTPPNTNRGRSKKLIF